MDAEGVERVTGNVEDGSGCIGHPTVVVRVVGAVVDEIGTPETSGKSVTGFARSECDQYRQNRPHSGGRGVIISGGIISTLCTARMRVRLAGGVITGR